MSSENIRQTTQSGQYARTSNGGRYEQRGQRRSTKNRRKNNQILMWILTAIFAILFLSYLPSFASVLALVVAVLLAPIKKWQRFLRGFVNKRFKNIVATVLAVLTILAAPSGETTEQEMPIGEMSATVEEVESPTNEDVYVTAETDEITTASTTAPTTMPTTAPAAVPTTQTTEGEKEEVMVWVSKSGSKYHSKSSCSNMKNPSQISLDTAKSRGLGACSKCY